MDRSECDVLRRSVTGKEHQIYTHVANGSNQLGVASPLDALNAEG